MSLVAVGDRCICFSRWFDDVASVHHHNVKFQPLFGWDFFARSPVLARFPVLVY